jgi:hypothetical protein
LSLADARSGDTIAAVMIRRLDPALVSDWDHAGGAAGGDVEILTLLEDDLLVFCAHPSARRVASLPRCKSATGVGSSRRVEESRTHGRR